MLTTAILGSDVLFRGKRVGQLTGLTPTGDGIVTLDQPLEVRCSLNGSFPEVTVLVITLTDTMLDEEFTWAIVPDNIHEAEIADNLRRFGVA